MADDRLLTAAEVSERLNVSTAWVYAAAAAGTIPHVRLGRSVRFGWAEVEQWLEHITRPVLSARNDRHDA